MRKTDIIETNAPLVIRPGGVFKIIVKVGTSIFFRKGNPSEGVPIREEGEGYVLGGDRRSRKRLILKPRS